MDSAIASPVILAKMAVTLWDERRSLSSESMDDDAVLSDAVSQILAKAINDADFSELSYVRKDRWNCYWSWERPFEFFKSSAHCEQDILMASIADKLMLNPPSDMAAWTHRVLLPLISRLDKSWF